MRHLGFALGAIFLFAVGAGAQVSSGNPSGVTLTAWNPAPNVPTENTLYASASSTPTPALASLSLAEPAQPAPEPVQSVFQTYNMQIYVGYAFFRFYAEPKLTTDMNGLVLSAVYYPGGGWFAPEGEVTGTFGSIPTCTTKFVMAAGGGRVRWLGPRGIEVWGHVLVGYSNFFPQTALGNHAALAFEPGAGLDLNLRHQRWALRVEGDMIGTRYFSTGQYSPKVTAGIVVKF
jgi:hypothetical protein